MFSEVLNQASFNKELFIALNKIEKICSSKNKLYFHRDSTHISSNIISSFNFSQNENGLYKSILKILKESCYKSELLSGNSSDFFISFAINLLRNCLNFQNRNIVSFFKDWSEIFEKEFPLFVDYPTIKNVEYQLKKGIQDEQIQNLIINAFKLSGLESRIFIEPTKNSHSSIELKRGYTFQNKPIIEVFNPKIKWEQNYVKCLVIDGILANIHEVDQILVASTETKNPMIIFAKGFEGEISSTIKYNNLNKSFNIFLAKMDLEIDFLNVLNDIAVVSGGDVISSLKGEILNLINYEKIPVLEYVCCLNNNITIINNKADKNIKSHVKRLTHERDQYSDVKMVEIYNNRMKNLSANLVNIKIASFSEQERLLKIEKLDLGMRICRSVMKYGTFNKDKINIFTNKIKKHRNCEVDIFTDALEKSFNKIGTSIPSMSIIAGIKYGIAFAENILSISGAIVKENALQNQKT